LRNLEIDMPSFCGRLRTREDEFIWFYANPGSAQTPE
jgi:hypothetical protein